LVRIAIDKRLSNAAAIETARFNADRMLRAWSWKSGLGPGFPPIVCFMGGTGTGKSTLFNSAVGGVVSEVGARRPLTLHPVILASQRVTEAIASCPLLAERSGLASGAEDGQPRIIASSAPSCSNMVLIDAPDFDSVAQANHLVADNLFLIADVLILVASQEKYGDLAGHLVARRSLKWGKKTLFVMNKVTSQSAYQDFAQALAELGYSGLPLRVERIEGRPDLIPGLFERPEFAGMLTPESYDPDGKSLIALELGRLKSRTALSIQELVTSIEFELERTRAVAERVLGILNAVRLEMEERGDVVFTPDLEVRVRERLQSALRKYDILATPRAAIRNVLSKLVSVVAETVMQRNVSGASTDDAQRNQDLAEAKSKARLEPLEAAVAALNLRIAQMLRSDPGLEDLWQISWADVPRWDRETLRAMYDREFPGVEAMLEKEFRRLQEGLSAYDQVRLYGSYTVWTLFIVTVEIAVGGGFSLFDAVLDSIIVPLIPKWVLSLKIVEVLREIAARVDGEHRRALRTILERQASLYADHWAGLLPDHAALDELRRIRERLAADSHERLTGFTSK
jgi:hypothetical protein